MNAKILLSAMVMASIGLSGCVVSDSPAMNAAATMGAIGAASWLYYSLSDGYYYDQDYNRMPRNYRPADNIRVQRVDNMDNYRNQRNNNYRNQPNYQRNDHRNQPNYQRNRDNPRDWNDSYRYDNYR